MSAPDPVASSATPAPRVGRPPRVSAEAIVEAAVELGLDRVTLKQVADRLGVAVATLYRHVRSRDELVRMAAFRLVLQRRMPQPGVAGEVHWAQIAAGFAAGLFETFVAEPQLISEMARGRLGPDSEVDFLEQFLAAMAVHGIDGAEAVRLHNALAMLTIGAAAGAASIAAARAAGAPHEQAMREVFEQRDADELPHLRAALEHTINIDPGQWLTALRDLLVGFATARGETLPDDLPLLVAITKNGRDDGRPRGETQ